MSDRDPLENEMDKDVEDMMTSELVAYIHMYFRHRYDIDLPMEASDRATIESFQKRYGKDKAGRIVQYVMLVKGGRKDGEYINTAVFSKGMKWWTDKMYLELQAREQKQARSEVGREKIEAGFFDASQLV